ncbi:hydroxymethylbilane synthase [Kroppenstedtia pulmonis]|uniref:Porphobilinogen deaminase n=1 Tax=Kroppenstedtia pulmonis TaxID=1380685 RepID=A0A7D4CLT4_9BACL|nr:hydroxymethylbilane synthase [Kroppenstedtia pulmonis]QKG84078.1 hydroxymethylbilane synthase [Kroppenstedtia pulmonis]
MRQVRVGTRRSELAVTQTEWVMNQMEEKLPDSWELIKETIVTRGDQILNVTLSKVGGKGLFVKEIEQALLDGRIDLAVHSMKDMPGEMSAGLMMGAVSIREDPRDCLISRTGATLDQLPEQAVVGTSSLRRQAQVLAYRPDLQVKPVRGNLNTRWQKLMDGQFDALVLASAGIARMGWQDRVDQYLSEDVMLPAVGQGALAVQCRSDDHEILKILKSVHHEQTAAAIQAERSFLHAFEGGCHLPIAGYATVTDDQIHLRGLVAHPDGKRIIKGELSGSNGEEVGRLLAEELTKQGAGDLLKEVRKGIES